MNLQSLRAAIAGGYTGESVHAAIEAAADLLLVGEIWQSISAADSEAIEDYPNDPRGPSCLLLSFVQGQPIHSVIAHPASRYAANRGLPQAALLITVYRPDQRPHEWSGDYRVRLP